MSAISKRTDAELTQLLLACPQQDTRWRHYKGSEYFVAGCAIEEASGMPVVLYRPTGKYRLVFARPLAEWSELVIHDGAAVPRFTAVEG